MLLGAYGWIHNHWDDSFYPEDLPQDWQLTYYSNEFNAVLIPADLWSQESCLTTETSHFCEQWIDGVSDEFRFYIECGEAMLATISSQALSDKLHALQPQLAGLVISEENVSASFMKVLTKLATALGTEILICDSSRHDSQIRYFHHWENALARFVQINHDLLDLRVARQVVERLIAQFESDKGVSSRQHEKVTIIVNHPKLSANDLIKFRSVLEIMGL